jgi:hypothetical protein
MGINLGPDFEKSVAALAGINPTSYYPGSLDIAMLNPDPTADTTVQFVAQAGVSTVALKALIASTVKA